MEYIVNYHIVLLKIKDNANQISQKCSSKEKNICVNTREDECKKLDRGGDRGLPSSPIACLSPAVKTHTTH
jgi:hypothetical protein